MYPETRSQEYCSDDQGDHLLLSYVYSEPTSDKEAVFRPDLSEEEFKSTFPSSSPKRLRSVVVVLERIRLATQPRLVLPLGTSSFSRAKRPAAHPSISTRRRGFRLGAESSRATCIAKKGGVLCDGRRARIRPPFLFSPRVRCPPKRSSAPQTGGERV